MKTKIAIAIILLILSCLFACENAFDDNDYIWDNWITALFN